MDQDRIRKRLALLKETRGLLSESLPDSEEGYRRADRTTRDATERRVQILGEAELDVIKTLYKDYGKRVVGDEESLVDAMEGTLGKKLIEQVKKRRALRNKIIHAYLDIDLAEVFGQASNLKDVEEFEREVMKLIGGRPARPQS
ncbi:MAG: DUF86 domain-containing protein [Nitrososphaerota archaeon]|nr:DUF86 domain-containing protein [Nitrososphaerota archaeon]MDG7019972.1 DUF86 domain-containing protein [Nitrososphaerota archaeon]MDG7027315.1 DUF86 domain-containing protein [Nitrososphaerota archaeon]